MNIHTFTKMIKAYAIVSLVTLVISITIGVIGGIIFVKSFDNDNLLFMAGGLLGMLFGTITDITTGKLLIKVYEDYIDDEKNEKY